MVAFTFNEWMVVLLAFLLGLILGMFLLASPKWKRRYREEKRLRAEDSRLLAEETRRREALEAERQHWEARTIAERARDDRTPPPPA
jgi:uncharacterized membrane-anchored protein YhcB (DUF1043 family)